MTFVMNYIMRFVCVQSRTGTRARRGTLVVAGGRAGGGVGHGHGAHHGCACGTPRRAIARATGGPWGGLFTHRRGSMPHRARLEGALRLQELGVVLIRVRCRRLG